MRHLLILLLLAVWHYSAVVDDTMYPISGILEIDSNNYAEFEDQIYNDIYLKCMTKRIPVYKESEIINNDFGYSYVEKKLTVGEYFKKYPDKRVKDIITIMSIDRLSD